MSSFPTFSSPTFLWEPSRDKFQRLHDALISFDKVILTETSWSITNNIVGKDNKFTSFYYLDDPSNHILNGS
jgi:hypothetical protein